MFSLTALVLIMLLSGLLGTATGTVAPSDTTTAKNKVYVLHKGRQCDVSNGEDNVAVGGMSHSACEKSEMVAGIPILDEIFGGRPSIDCPALPPGTFSGETVGNYAPPQRGMTLTKVFHVEASLGYQCFHVRDFFLGNPAAPGGAHTPDGIMRYAPLLSFYDAAPYLANPPDAADGIYKRTGRPAGARALAAGVAGMLHTQAGDRELLLLTIAGGRNTTPQLYAFVERGWRTPWHPHAVRWSLFTPGRVVVPFLPWAGRTSLPPSSVYIYRVRAVDKEPPPASGDSYCKVAGRGEPLPPRNNAEWQFWVYERPDFLGRGIWTQERLCRNGPDSFRTQ